jgi:Zn-dependent protease with chaperone function
MRNFCIFAALFCTCAALKFGQDNRVFDRTPANNETISMEAARLHAGRTTEVLAGGILFGAIAAPHRIANATGATPRFNMRAQTTCEAEMLSNIDAHEVLSGKAYDLMTDVALAYGRPLPHIYIFPDGWNMAYVAASAAVDGRGKIVVGQQALDLFDSVALKGFIGHEMAHLVSDNAAQGCNDYIVRDPRVEAGADAIAARTLGRHPVRAFLERVLVLTEGQNWEAKRRLEILQ